MLDIFPDPLDYIDDMPWYHQIWGYPLFWIVAVVVWVFAILIVFPLNIFGDLIKSEKLLWLNEKIFMGFIFITYGLVERLFQKASK